MEKTPPLSPLTKLVADLNKPNQSVQGDHTRGRSVSFDPSPFLVGWPDEVNAVFEDHNCDLGRRATSYTCNKSEFGCLRKLENEASKFNKESGKQLPAIDSSVMPVDYTPDEPHRPDLLSAEPPLLPPGQHSERSARRSSPRHTDFQNSANWTSDSTVFQSEHELRQRRFSWSPDFFSVDM